MQKLWIPQNNKDTTPFKQRLAYAEPFGRTSWPIIITYVKKYFPKDQWLQACICIDLESKRYTAIMGDASLIDPDRKRGPSVGLMQIAAKDCSVDATKLTDPEYNIQQGGKKYRVQGWAPWSTMTKVVAMFNHSTGLAHYLTVEMKELQPYWKDLGF